MLRPGQSLAAVQRRALVGQVAGLYVPRTKRLYVLGSGGSPPRSVVAHEVVHALQDAHFQLTRGPFAPRPRDRDGELAAVALIEGDATEVQSRYVATLSPLDLLSELGRTLGSIPKGESAGEVPYVQRELIYPYTAGQKFVRALRARGGQRLLDRAFRNPPRTTAAVLDPARYLAGDPPPQPVALPAGTFSFTTTFGAEDLVALTGRERLARSWLGGRVGVGPRGLDLRLATRGAALGRRGPRAGAAARRGDRLPRPVRVRANPAQQGFSTRAFLPIGTAWSHLLGAVRQRVLPNGDCTQSSIRSACTCTAARRTRMAASSRRSR